MRTAYLDCFSGISGNMVLGALLDVGLPQVELEAELAKLNLSGFRLRVERVRRNGLAGTHVEVETEEQHAHRHLHDIATIISASTLAPQVKARSLTVFRRLAEVEARVHGEPVEHVHFHEVGALDAIVDVVGAVAGFWLLGVEAVYASAVHVGRGTVECAHGVIPVPAPATAELLRGVPIYGRDIDAELVTPTGAAILTTLVDTFGAAPPMRVEAIGYGAGTRVLPLPNLLRVSLGDSAAGGQDYEHDSVTLVETNIDDMSPQLYEYVQETLLAQGALDVYMTPILMKRNRPATLLSVLATEERLPDLIATLFAETTAIGVRLLPVQRWKLAREELVVATPYGQVGVKVARRAGAVVNISAEYRDCRRLAEESGVPLKEVQRLALEAAWRLAGEGAGAGEA